MLILQGHRTEDKVHTLAFSPDGTSLASAAGKSPLILSWDLATGQQRQVLRGHTHRIASLAFASAAYPLLASADCTGKVNLWDIDNVRPLMYSDQVQPHLNADLRLCFSPSGDELAVNGSDDVPHRRPRGGKQLVLWRISTFVARRVISAHARAITSVAFSPDGRTLATGSYDFTVKLWDVQTLTATGSLFQGKKVHHLAFAPDGRTLASASMQGLVKVWDAATGQKRTTLQGQAGFLHALAYSSDGRTLATAGGDGTVRFWNVETGKSRQAFDWGVGAVQCVAFAPDGQRAAVGGVGQVVVWDLDEWGA